MASYFWTGVLVVLLLLFGVWLMMSLRRVGVAGTLAARIVRRRIMSLGPVAGRGSRR